MSIAAAEEHISSMRQLVALSRAQVIDCHSALVGDSLNFDELLERFKSAEKLASDAVVAGKCADSMLPLPIRNDIQKFMNGGAVSNMPNLFAESKRHAASKTFASAQETAVCLLNQPALHNSSSPHHLLPSSHMLSTGVFADVSLRSDARSLEKQLKALSRFKEVAVTEHTESACVRIQAAAPSFVAELVLEKFLHCYEISSVNIRPLKGANSEIPSAFFAALRASAECRLAQGRRRRRYYPPPPPPPPARAVSASRPRFAATHLCSL
jgi:hypothetical protein